MSESEIFNFLFCSENLEQLKKNYITLVRKLHPDKGGSVEACQILNKVFDKLQRHPKFAGRYEQDKKAYAEEKRTAPDESFYFVGKETMRIISILSVLDGLSLEICGTWLWIAGATFNYKQVLKGLGCKWASSKKMWCFHETEWTRKNRHTLDMDEIRSLHGSQKIEQHYTNKLKMEV